MSALPAGISVRPATPDDVPLILAFIRELAEYENLTHEVSATEELLQTTLSRAVVGAPQFLAQCADLFLIVK